jgi:acetylornithine/succinyldiaminopimelate/putrescine aminotransferase
VVNGVTPTSIRFAPPLTVSSTELAEGVALLAGVLADGPIGDDPDETGEVDR